MFLIRCPVLYWKIFNVVPYSEHVICNHLEAWHQIPYVVVTCDGNNDDVVYDIQTSSKHVLGSTMNAGFPERHPTPRGRATVPHHHHVAAQCLYCDKKVPLPTVASGECRNAASRG